MARAEILIAVALDPKKRGSMEEQIAAIARRLSAGGVGVTLLVGRRPATAAAGLIEGAGARVEVTDFARPLVAAAALHRVARARRPRIIHLHFVRIVSPIVIAACTSGSRVILNEHMPLHDGGAGVRRRLKRGVYGGVARLLAARVAVSRHVAETVIAVEGTPPSRVCVIENGVSLGRFARAAAMGRARAREALGFAAEGPPIIACVARMVREKGVDVAIRALARLGPGARAPVLLLVGDGRDRAAYAGLAAGLGIGDRVRFLGLRDDVEVVLAACDQAWMPSRAEAFGLAAAEAMAAGRPVIASAVGGLREVVEDGATGLLVPPGDDGALADAAAALLADPARAKAMGAAGRARAEARFSMERFVDRVTGLYAALDPALRVDPCVASGAGR